MELWPAMLRVYQRHDIDCVIDIFAPPDPDSAVDQVLAELGITRIVLFPSFESCLERHRRRAREPMSDAEQLAHNYEDIAHGVNKYRPANVIDNGELSTDEIIDSLTQTPLASRGLQSTNGHLEGRRRDV